MKTGGELIIYTPVKGKIILPFYKKALIKLDHYEKIQQRKRIYSVSEICKKVEAAGLEIVEQQAVCGDLGIISHEIYSSILLAISNLNSILPLLPYLLLLLLLFPLVVILKVIDFYLPHRSGNGLLLVARKS